MIREKERAKGSKVSEYVGVWFGGAVDVVGSISMEYREERKFEAVETNSELRCI